MSVILLFIASSSVFGGNTVNLPKTGQTKCYDQDGAEISCPGTGKDGELQAGIVWPDPRFIVEGECVTDKLTGLMWTRSANHGGRGWNDAIDYTNNLELCGYTDWRLPNVIELESLVNAGQADNAVWLSSQGFVGLPLGMHWTSTARPQSSYDIWIIDMWSGMVFESSRNMPSGFFVWPVRGNSMGSAQVWRTGQTETARPGDDGDLKKGAQWPSPRFTDCGNGIVADNLTGLEWSQDANTPGPAKCGPGSYRGEWQAALDYVKCLNANVYLGYSDWRLPNRKELMSLIDWSQYNPALPSGHPFSNVKPSWYWSSTSRANPGYSNFVWLVCMEHGGAYDAINNYSSFPVWPVRAGFIDNRTLAVVKTGKNAGIVTSIPSGISCGTICKETFFTGTVVTLTATGNSTSAFDGWSGGGCTGFGECAVTMSDDVTVTAAFASPPVIVVSPLSLNFNTVKRGVTSPEKVLTVRHTGGRESAHLIISAISITGTNAVEFSETNDCSKPLARGKKCEIHVDLTATSYGTKVGQLAIVSNDPQRQTIQVSLTGSAKPPQISVSPQSVNFGTHQVSSLKPGKRKITITNRGISDLTIVSITLVSGDGSFAQTNSCGILAQNKSCSIDFVFDPSSSGVKEGYMDIISNDPRNETVRVTVKGMGT